MEVHHDHAMNLVAKANLVAKPYVLVKANEVVKVNVVMDELATTFEKHYHRTADFLAVEASFPMEVVLLDPFSSTWPPRSDAEGADFL